jgi:CubicO group peptidase (beta-lactamase class C family)
MKQIRFRFFLSAAVILSFAAGIVPAAAFAQTARSAQTAQTDLDKRLAAIEQKVDARRKELGIPGIAVAIVKDGKVVYAKGLGFRDIDKKLPVTADTQFAIGSATKAFTALSVLMAQDEGKLSLDDSPKKYLPYFKMYDPDTDKNITIRDLLSHSSGLNRTDLAMLTGKLTRAELIQVAAQAKPTAKLREKFQYQNIMFTAAGEIVSQVEKTPWEKFIEQRIFAPLSMTNSDLSIAEMSKAKDRSLGYDHNFDTKETKELPYRAIDEVAPAGSINSSANDMAKWLRFILAGGEANGKRLVSETGFSEWLKPQMKIAPDGSFSYGLGWFLQKWNGMKVVQHGGNIDGFNSMVAMIPEKNVGFVMLSNVSASSLGGDMMPIVWNGLLSDKSESTALSADELQALSGNYKHDSIASLDVQVKADNGVLKFETGGQHLTLELIKGREFKIAEAPDGFSVTFLPSEGQANELYLKQPQGDFLLKRVRAGAGENAAEKTKSPAYAKELAGRYTAPDGIGLLDIIAAGDAVTVNLPLQQPYTLVEISKDAFRLSPLPETYTLSPVRDAGQKVIAVVVKQPEGEFRFERSGDVAETIPADELMKKAIAAAGGEENIRKLKSRVVEFDTDLESQGVKAFGKIWIKAPNKTATETTMTALGKEIAKGFEYFDGTKGSEAYTFAEPSEFTGKRLADIKRSADLTAALKWREDYKSVEVTGKQKIEGEEAWVVRFDPKEGTPFTEYYSTKTFLLLRHDGVIPSSTSSVNLPYQTTYSDYRNVDGSMIAFKQVSYSDSNGSVVTTFKSVKDNVDIPDSIFAPRKLK